LGGGLLVFDQFITRRLPIRKLSLQVRHGAIAVLERGRGRVAHGMELMAEETIWIGKGISLVVSSATKLPVGRLAKRVE
jgi:hypothetical protein